MFTQNYIIDIQGNLEDAFIQFMEQVDELRSRELYIHNYCNDKCIARGCGRVWVFDGLWKLRYPVCMVSSVILYIYCICIPDNVAGPIKY